MQCCEVADEDVLNCICRLHGGGNASQKLVVFFSAFTFNERWSIKP